jgi:RimJ/RimL family protein N-acetyltransferase
MVENEGSNALFKKFGFRKIGIGKDELIKNGKKKDVYIWELLKSNYKK